MPLRAVFVTFALALAPAAGSQSAPGGELYGVWALEAAAGSAGSDREGAHAGDVAIWQTATGIGLTWGNLPPETSRQTVEFAYVDDTARLDVVRSNFAADPGDRIEARIEPERLVIRIASERSGPMRIRQYDFYISAGKLVYEYRLQQDTTTLESASAQLRRLKVVM